MSSVAEGSGRLPLAGLVVIDFGQISSNLETRGSAGFPEVASAAGLQDFYRRRCRQAAHSACGGAAPYFGAKVAMVECDGNRSTVDLIPDIVDSHRQTKDA